MIWLLIGIIIGSVALDQLTKWLAVIYLEGEASFPLWKNVFHLTFVKNKGAAFGMLSDQRWVFMIFSSVAIIALAIYLFKFCKQSPWVKISLAMIIGGGIGNMIDRVLLGYVIDFLDFTLINFAVFNVADCFVTVGAFMLIGYLLWDMIREARKPSTPQAVEESEDTAVPSAQNEDPHDD